MVMTEDVDLTKLQPNTMIEGPLWNGQAAFIGMEGRILTVRQDGQTKRIPILGDAAQHPPGGVGERRAVEGVRPPWSASATSTQKA